MAINERLEFLVTKLEQIKLNMILIDKQLK